MTLRPGLIVESMKFGGLYMLLYERPLPGMWTGVNWAMLDLETGCVYGEMPHFLLDGKTYIARFEDD